MDVSCGIHALVTLTNKASDFIELHILCYVQICYTTRAKHRYEDNIKVDFKETRCEGVK
jgi:hypothetical protein